MIDELTVRRRALARERGGGFLDESLADPAFRRAFEEECRTAVATDTHSPACALQRGCPCEDSNFCWHVGACDCGGDARELVHVEV